LQNIYGSYVRMHLSQGSWGDVEIKPYGPMVEPSCKVFHYGQAILRNESL
jgi:hypothetical protein